MFYTFQRFTQHICKIILQSDTLPISWITQEPKKSCFVFVAGYLLQTQCWYSSIISLPPMTQEDRTFALMEQWPHVWYKVTISHRASLVTRPLYLRFLHSHVLFFRSLQKFNNAILFTKNLFHLTCQSVDSIVWFNSLFFNTCQSDCLAGRFK